MKLASRRPPSLKLVLGGLAAGAFALPFAMIFIVSLILKGSGPNTPVFRLEYLNAELRKTVSVEGDGRLTMRPGYRPPPGLELIVEGSDGRILFSTLEAFVLGDIADFSEVAKVAHLESSVSSFFSETVSEKGRVVGRYFAWFTAKALPLNRPPSPVGLLVIAGFIALMFATGGVIAAQLARAVLKLESAAGRIAAGDLESEVRVRGIREIVDLSRAMDGMRAALREDRDQQARFLAAVSHDLRTPLTSIGGYLEAVEDGLASDPETLERYVRIMRSKTRILEGRIASLIEFAHMETGEWRMGFETIELRPYLESLCRDFREDAFLLGREFSFDLSALSGLCAAVDKALLARAFENLVSNAIRYSPKSSAVSMVARRRYGGGPGVFVIDLDDHGPGIAPAERERVFEAFMRGAAAKEGEGIGLGLYIARSVIKGHGWDICAAEAPGGGGRISVTIPAPASRSN
jgi:signal transduction histidine kinase